MVKKWILILLITGFINACQKQNINQIPYKFDYGYFPLVSGSWNQYAVTFINIDAPSNVNDTIRYQLLIKYMDWYLNAANDSMIRIVLEIRDSSHNSWKPFGVWQAGIKDRDAIQIEENIKYVKIKFPVTMDSKWNGDIYNRLDTLNQYNYLVTSLDISEAIGNLNFDSVLTITQKDKFSNIDKVYFFEKFALGIGLIEKQMVDIRTDTVDTTPIEQRTTKGTQYFQKIVAFGKN